ncbi:MAG: type II secretion system protein [Bacilli bacterium]
MNNQKAFTLIEILAVIVIIGVISLITVPVVTKVLKDTGDKIFESNTELLRIAAENYYKMDTTLLPQKCC